MRCLAWAVKLEYIGLHLVHNVSLFGRIYGIVRCAVYVCYGRAGFGYKYRLGWDIQQQQGNVHDHEKLMMGVRKEMRDNGTQAADSGWWEGGRGHGDVQTGRRGPRASRKQTAIRRGKRSDSAKKQNTT